MLARPKGIPIGSTWQPIYDEYTAEGIRYFGPVEKCTFEIWFLPEEVPGVEQIVVKSVDAIYQVMQYADIQGTPLRTRIWYDSGDWWNSKWKFEITAHASPIAWATFLALWLVVLGLVVIWACIQEVKDETYFPPWTWPVVAGSVGLIAIAFIVRAFRSPV